MTLFVMSSKAIIKRAKLVTGMYNVEGLKHALGVEKYEKSYINHLRRSSSELYLRIQPVPQREHHTLPLKH
jgi:hypothetical protein